MSEELKPCPFCGGEAGVSYTARAHSPEPAFRLIECDDCSACGESFEIVGGNDHAAITRAIAAWNTRTPDPAVIGELVEALEKARAVLVEHYGALLDQYPMPDINATLAKVRGAV